MSQSGYPIDFVRHKAVVAQRLAAGECGGFYGDAILIISSVISSLAAQLFPGLQIDRRRFVQLWVRYAEPSLEPARISVPLLAQSLYESGDHVSLAGLRSLRQQVFWLFPEQADGLVLHGDVDATEQEVLSVSPQLSLREVRAFSYPNLFYAEVRSGYVHEGDTTELASSRPGGTRPADISYANVMQKPFRRIHFSVSWLSRLIESIGTKCTSDIYKPPSQLPAVWWLDGGAA